MSTFDDDLAAALDAAPDTRDVDVLVNKKPYLLRFTQIDGPAWADAVDHAPVRADVGIDRAYGYNIRAAVLHVAPASGVLIVDGEERHLQVDGDDVPRKDRVNQWADLLRALSGHDFQRVCDAVWALNERGPQLATEAAKKALSASDQSSDSPSA